MASKHMLQIRVEKSLGLTLDELIRQARLSRAEDLLLHSDRPVADIAEECGFTSTSHLALRIKEAHGLTPLKFRQSGGKSRR